MASAIPTHQPEHVADFKSSLTSDVDGSYSFSYSGEDSSKTERRLKDGTILGGYKYIDTDGQLQTVIIIIFFYNYKSNSI